MTYNEIMQKAGKQIFPKVYYVLDGNRVDLDEDDFKYARIFYNSNIVGTLMKGLELEVKSLIPSSDIYLEITAKYDEKEAIKLYGGYKFLEEPTYNADSKTYTYKLYDEMLASMVDYVSLGIEYPTTIYDFFVKLCEACGYTTNVESLPNGDKLLEKDIYTGIGFTYRDVFQDIGQATGTLFYIENNEVKELTFGTEEIVINDDILKNQNISLGRHFGPVNSIVLTRAGGADSIYKKDEESVLENGVCEFKIEDNQLMNENNRDEFLPALLERLKGIEFDIFDTELVGYGGFEPLAKIRLETADGEEEKVFNSYVFNNEQIITQGFSESIYTEYPEETQTDYKASDTTDRRLNQVFIIVNKQNQTITSLVETTNRVSEGFDSLEQNVIDVNDKIDNNNEMLETLRTEVIQNNTSVTAKIEKIESDLETGVENLKNTLVTIDINGISVSTNTSAIKTLMTNEKFAIQDKNDKDLFFVGYDYELGKTVSRIDNLTVTNYFIAGYHRTEKYKNKNGEYRTGDFYIE